MTKPVLVVGSIAFDNIETPHDRVVDELGGSATHFSVSASHFAPVQLVGVVGGDFPAGFRKVFDERGVDVAGLVTADGETFRWSGKYEGAMNEAETLWVELNVFDHWRPQIPEAFRSTPFVFLANGSPQTQSSVLDQMQAVEFSVLDTMNLWIKTEHEALTRLIKRVDCLVLNEDEAHDLTGAPNLVAAGQAIHAMGPPTVVIKKGEHGALLFHKEHCYPFPAFPIAHVVDPTGAGDSFAGGLVGALARHGEVTLDSLRAAMLYATVMASHNVSDFGLRALRAIDDAGIERRLGELLDLFTPASLVS